MFFRSTLNKLYHEKIHTCPMYCYVPIDCFWSKFCLELEAMRDSVNKTLSEEILFRKDSVNQKLYKVAYIAPTDSLKIAE